MEKKPFIFHSSKDEKVRVTVVGDYVDGVLKLAASRCSDKDSFVKKVGRDIASERLDKGILIASIEIENMSMTKFINSANCVANAVIENGIEQKITLVKTDKMYGPTWDGKFAKGSEDTFFYTLV